MIEPILSLFAATCKENTFFGLIPWYHYINDGVHFQGCNLKQFTFFSNHSDVPLVLLAIIDDLLRIAGLMALGFIIYGAIKFMTSEGNPEATAKAQSTILNALIGLVIAVVAVAFVSFLGNRLGG